MTIFKDNPPEKALITEMGAVPDCRYGQAKQAFADINIGQNEFYIEFHGFDMQSPDASEIYRLEDGVQKFTQQPRIAALYSEDIEQYAQKIRNSNEQQHLYTTVKKILTMEVILHKRGSKSLLCADEIILSAPQEFIEKETPHRIPEKVSAKLIF